MRPPRKPARAIAECGPWEDRDGNTVGADDEEFGFDAKFVVMPATAALIAKVEAEGGDIAWDDTGAVADVHHDEEDDE